MQITIIIVTLAVVALFGLLVWKTRKNRKLPASAAGKIRSMLQKTHQLQDPVMRILEYDKILDQLLYRLGFQGSVADKLKRGGTRFSNVQTLWTYHKLRNTLAHEHGATATVREADGFRDALEKALRQVS